MVSAQNQTPGSSLSIFINPGNPGWRELASAFYALVRGDECEFYALGAWLKDTGVGVRCQAYRLTADHRCLEEAGYLLTGTRA